MTNGNDHTGTGVGQRDFCEKQKVDVDNRLKQKPAISKTRQTELIARAIQFRILILGNDSHKKDDGRYARKP